MLDNFITAVCHDYLSVKTRSRRSTNKVTTVICPHQNDLHYIKIDLISHFPIENRKASMDCLEGQSKVAENFKS